MTRYKALVQNTELDALSYSDPDHLDKNFENPRKHITNILIGDFDSESDCIPCFHQIEKTVSETKGDIDAEKTININIELTKKGTVRKRKKYEVNVERSKINKKEAKVLTEYFVKTGCRANVCIKSVQCILLKSVETYKPGFLENVVDNRDFFLCNTSQTKPARPKISSVDMVQESKNYIRSKTV